jgi:hypothetical protein
MRSIASRVAVMALLIGCVAPSHLCAQGLVRTSRLSATLALEAVAACAKNGYAVSAVVVTIDGARQAVLRGDCAPVHTLEMWRIDPCVSELPASAGWEPRWRRG